jgi:hypothetical protein
MSRVSCRSRFVLVAVALTGFFVSAGSAVSQTVAGGGAASTSSASSASAPSSSLAGILLLAHGGSKEWNANVEAIAADAGKSQPTEVALGMADRTTMQAGIDKLTARGVTQIVAVPLFVSSHSSVIGRSGGGDWKESGEGRSCASGARAK